MTLAIMGWLMLSLFHLLVCINAPSLVPASSSHFLPEAYLSFFVMFVLLLSHSKPVLSFSLSCYPRS
jgi:hypothetical protein